jgi:hypothetical protein
MSEEGRVKGVGIRQDEVAQRVLPEDARWRDDYTEMRETILNEKGRGQG